MKGKIDDRKIERAKREVVGRRRKQVIQEWLVLVNGSER